MAPNLDDLFAMAASEAGPSDGREAGGLYNPDGDCIQFFSRDTAYRRDRVDGLLTLYRALDSDRVIGFQLKGVSRLSPRVEGVDVIFSDKEVHAIGFVTAVMMTYAANYLGVMLNAPAQAAPFGRYVEAASVVPQLSFTRGSGETAIL